MTPAASIDSHARAEKAAQVAASIEAACAARSVDRRTREAAAAAARLERKRAAKAAHATHLIEMPRMAALLRAGVLLGSAQDLAQAMDIKPRSLRAKLTAERGISNDDLTAAAAALEARAEHLIAHALKLRQEAGL